MADNDKKKYYWIKLDKGFFKRHDIRIIESMPNGKDYILFYLKLLCESTSHEGYLRFSETIPYSEEMLSTITDTNVDIVRNAVNVFAELNMMEILSDGTYFMSEVQRITGSETGNAKRKREYRDNKKAAIETMLGQCPLEIEKEIDKEYICANNGANAPIESANETSFDKEKAFIEFWNLYPKKVNKKKAKDKFCKVCKNLEIFNKLMNGLTIQIESKDWLKDNGQFIPHPFTWLNGERWEDEIPKSEINKTVTYEEMRESDPFFD